MCPCPHVWLTETLSLALSWWFLWCLSATDWVPHDGHGWTQLVVLGAPAMATAFALSLAASQGEMGQGCQFCPHDLIPSSFAPGPSTADSDSGNSVSNTCVPGDTALPAAMPAPSRPAGGLRDPQNSLVGPQPHGQAPQMAPTPLQWPTNPGL